MIFNEPAYFLLLAVVALAYRLLPGAAKPWLLAGMGVLFYAYFSPAFVGVLAAEAALVYVMGAVIRRSGRGSNIAFALGLALTVGMLVAFKYAGLLSASVARFGTSDLPTFEDVRLPLAISFFTFEFVHYLVDARRGTLPDHEPGDFLAFAFFVPTMVAGPIKRFQGFWAQVRVARANASDIAEGTTRVLTGMLKKVVLADTLTLWITPLASADSVAGATRGQIVAALVAYSLRIYLDFSGYSDIAIGSARLFGIRVPENFAWPYLATNIAEFWRRWHMSLMSWIRDYVYIPLGGNHGSLLRQTGVLLAAFALSGLWHGAAWHFMGWGLFHGTLMVLYRVWHTRIQPKLWPAIRPAAEGDGGERDLGSRVFGGARSFVSAALTFSLVTLGWGLFAMPLSRFGLMLQQLVTGGM